MINNIKQGCLCSTLYTSDKMKGTCIWISFSSHWVVYEIRLLNTTEGTEFLKVLVSVQWNLTKLNETAVFYNEKHFTCKGDIFPSVSCKFLHCIICLIREDSRIEGNQNVWSVLRGVYTSWAQGVAERNIFHCR